MTDLAIIGGGQLGCLLHAAATALDLSATITDTATDSPAQQLTGFIPAATWAEAAQHVADSPVVTWEREDLPVTDLEAIGTLRPAPNVLATIQDRLLQKQLLDQLGVATAAWTPATADDTIDDLVSAVPLPAMVKARRGGFDGRGQQLVRSADELSEALQRFANCGAIIESLVPFDEEFAILLTRDQHGNVVYYPLVTTYQDDGQLSWAVAEATSHPQLTAWAQDIAHKIADGIDHVGTIAVECFRIGEEAVVNEIAPRVHNSGHWTIDGCSADQFENHVRAVTGLPLRQPEALGCSLLLNCIGTMPETSDTPGLHRYDYGKSARAKRKVGHLILVAPDLATLNERYHALPAELRARWGSELTQRLTPAT
ncbi:MAG: 5-(carboxyamino)imidazole ribonucleotide synthase [Planctomycetota bacterium]|jgi:5-(carboxyamino)imidazole ribonucleotide synthase